MKKSKKSHSILLAGLIILCLPFVLIQADDSITRPDATSSDGLKMEGFSFRSSREGLTSGAPYLITFRLVNVSDHPITFHEQYGVFVGARHGNDNIDFGHKAKGKTLQPGESVPLKQTNHFGASGTYRFWPAYHANGHWGPYRWNEIVVEVTD